MELLNIFMDSYPVLLKGVVQTIQIAFFSLVGALILGFVFGMFRISSIKILRGFAKVYVSVIRGTPFYVQLIFFYFGLIPFLLNGSVSPITSGILVLSINAGAYLVEIFRAGIESIDKGQTEAGRSLGFSQSQTMRYIILPQAIKRMVPAFMNQFIISIKDTSLLATIGVMELTYSAQTIYAMNFKAFELLAIIGVMYWIIITILTVVATKVERRMSQS